MFRLTVGGDTVHHGGEGMTQRVKPLAIVSIVRKRQAGIRDTLYARSDSLLLRLDFFLSFHILTKEFH